MYELLHALGHFMGRPAVLLSVLLLSVSCGQKAEVKEHAPQAVVDEAFLSKITTEKAVLKTKEKEITLTGKVEYNPDKIIRYIPLTSGIADRIYFSTGDKVEQGQTLLDLRSTELSRLQSELSSLEAEQKIAERELQTANALYKDNMLSERDWLEAQAKLNQINASLKRTELDMSFYSYNQHTGTFSVLAPMSGYIVHRNISSGSTLSGDGEPVFTIADLSSVWIMANVYARDLQAVREGMEVEITLLSYPDEVFSGKITKLSNVFDQEERVLKARILMDNKDLKFKPEMSAIVKVRSHSDELEVAVPSTALIFDNNRYFVIVEKEGRRFEVREVGLDHRVNGSAYLKSGLEDGENVVVENQLLLYSHLK